jgi:hypothetical protein
VESRGKTSSDGAKRLNAVEQQKLREKEGKALLKQQKADEEAKRHEEQEARKRAAKEERCGFALPLSAAVLHAHALLSLPLCMHDKAGVRGGQGFPGAAEGQCSAKRDSEANRHEEQGALKPAAKEEWCRHALDFLAVNVFEPFLWGKSNASWRVVRCFSGHCRLLGSTR